MKKYLFFLLLFGFTTTVFSQTVPPNTRLFQVNTVKGSALSLVESSENYIYHVGTSNSGEIGIDGLSTTSVGLDDMFILKSNAASGLNVWLETFNSGGNGVIAPRYVTVDSSENVYVYGQFSGTITAGTSSVTATTASSSFLMKINSSGSEVWVTLLSGGNNTTYPKVKCVTDGTDTFIVYNQNHLARINDADGSIIYDKLYGESDLKSVALLGSSLYLAGSTTNNSAIFGSEIIPAGSGFVLHGDKNAVFSASAVASLVSSPSNLGPWTDVSDIAVAADGNLLISGFSKGAMNLIMKTYTHYYSYDPNGSFNNNMIYHFVAKIMANFNDTVYFKTSTPVSSDAIYGIQGRIIHSKIKTYGSEGKFHVTYTNNHFDNRNTIKAFTNPNGTNTTLTSAGAGTSYKVLLAFNQNGSFSGEVQPQTNGIISNGGANYSVSTQASRLFKTFVYNAASGATLWTKEKSTSVGGTLSNVFIKHLTSANNDLFVTSLVEGKSNFFGKQVNNSPGVSSRYVSRLGADGLSKWSARFHPDSGVRELNVSNDFSCVDKDDNFIMLANTSGATSTFIDAVGNFVDFNQDASLSSQALIKLDKDGTLLWSKQLLPTAAAATITAALRADAVGNVHVLGTTSNNFTVDGTTIQSSGSPTIFLLKFSPDGNLLYAKSYQNLGAYSLNPVFDAENNLFVFTEPISYTGGSYNFDGITIQNNTENNADHLMLKFNTAGNVVWGKNFYFNGDPNNFDYSWPNDVQFDGTNFILMGNYNTQRPTSDYVGLDMMPIPRVYPTGTFIPFLAKINTSGSVIWQQPLHINFSMTSNYTNIEVDQDKNIYMSWYVKDKLTYKGAEYSFDTAVGNKILTKWDTEGNLKYNKIFDIYNSSYPMVDVMANDKVNISGLTTSTNILNYPVNYNRASSMYIATFGELDSYYMTPSKDYLQLNSLDIANNPDNNNTFSFDLLNNVDWTASSDQAWLNLSFLSLTEKNNFKNSISGNGDAKIILSANTNETGVNRTSNVMISGTGVSSKTIAITQSGLLASGEAKTFVSTLYPNPTSDILNIETQQKISKIEIFDLSGKLMKSTSGKDKNVSVSNLATGMYLIKLYTESGVVNSKFIKN